MLWISVREDKNTSLWIPELTVASSALNVAYWMPVIFVASSA